MDSEVDELNSLPGYRVRSFSNASQNSQPSSKLNFPVLTNDSGLYTWSSNTSDCSLQLESDTDCCHQCHKNRGLKDERLQLALHDVRKLRSELERLAQSEQWYKQELRQQKSTRLDDLERIYTQERKFMQENQRLQKECVRLYEKCNELERELEKQNQESLEFHVQHLPDIDNEQNELEFEKDQQLAVIKDQQQLITVLRKQKRSLLEDLRSLTEEKDEKVMELQRLLVDLEYDNKVITKKCTQLGKERFKLENELKNTDSKLSTALQEKLGLQKSIIDLKEQLVIQQQLLKLKETEVDHIQQHYTHKIQHEEDLDQVHVLSIKYQEEINSKTLEIIHLKERLQEMQDEIEDMQKLQEQNELQQRQIDQLNFSIETYRLELQELKASEELKNKQLHELHTAMDQVIKDKEFAYKTSVEHKNGLVKVRQALKSTQEEYAQLQELYKKTQFQLEMLEIEHGKIKFESERDQEEIQHLRKKLQEYMEQTTVLSSKIQFLEQELAQALTENCKLKESTVQMKKDATSLLEQLPHQEVTTGHQNIFVEDLDDPDFIKLQHHFANLHAQLDFMKDNQVVLNYHQPLQTAKEFIEDGTQVQEADKESPIDSIKSSVKLECLTDDVDFLNVSVQGGKLLENLDKLNEFLKEKQQILSQFDRIQDSNKGIEKLVIENEILKQKLSATEAEALTLQIKQDINEGTQKYIQLNESLESRVAKVANLQESLLKNDGKLYKLERKLKILEEVDEELEILKLENTKLKEKLRQEEASKTELKLKLKEESENLGKLEQTLEELKMNPITRTNQATQCLLLECHTEEHEEIKQLKENIIELQQQQRVFLEAEANKKEDRLRFLHQMVNLQNDKMQNLQKNQKEWEDVLTSLNNAQALEEQTRKELELKRMELEELNQVFAEQNEELRKLEEFTALLELKRQKEKEQLKLTFQQEINVMKENLQEYQQEIETQKLINQQLEKHNKRFQQDVNKDYATEVAGYKNEIRELRSRINRITEEKEDLLESLKEMKKQTKDLKDNKREAVLIPDFSLNKLMDTSLENPEVLKQTISEDHLRVLTKVLEAEYQRKMLRYDEHIHSLLSNLKSLKKSLKINEEKTALLSEEQLKAKAELKDLQKTKRSLEEMRLKYDQSQNTINELKHSLAFERKKFELSDLGKSSQTTAYEVSNLIDDYKKLIQQSAAATRRPSTSAILDLIQRSNQYVPNFEKLEHNVEGLRSDLQNFLTSYSHKIPATSLIATSSLSVPPSLMDELRAASEGF